MFKSIRGTTGHHKVDKITTIYMYAFLTHPFPISRLQPCLECLFSYCPVDTSLSVSLQATHDAYINIGPTSTGVLI